MRKIALAIAATAIMLGGASVQAKPRLTPQQQLDKLLEGREAGEPTSCIPQFETRDMQILDKTAIVYGRGNTIWVNVPKNPEHLDDDDILLTRTNGSQLCDLDIVQTLDRTSQVPNGFISLGKFVPYRKVPKPAAPAN
ncbi:MAG: hypothetical protein GXC70_01155 [Sphingomonadaceae bacterium]|nr:hypothetical protein [Sphingomonadaceae bacterium]